MNLIDKLIGKISTTLINFRNTQNIEIKGSNNIIILTESIKKFKKLKPTKNQLLQK